ncbi:MAG: hypothetical protein JNK87_00075 [Bryobacterales bacterium]|nr:hypothetical protein [Bryobacterales bacterium]
MLDRLAFAVLVPALAWGQAENPRWKPAVTLQTGLSSTFQMTLGGTFGEGPAWFHRATIDFPDVLRKGDGLVLQGWLTRDLPSTRQDWTLGLAYRPRVWAKGKHVVASSFGWQRWLFPSVLSGANDHLVASNVTYRTKWKLPIQVSADNWVLVSSPLRRGNATYIQAGTQHTLWKAGSKRVVLKHGPATTYSYHFYDRSGWRVLRYTGSLLFETRYWTVEGSLRQQDAIAARVPNNRYWCFQLTRRM